MNTVVMRNDWVGQVIDGRFLLIEWLGGTEQESVFRTELHGPQPRRAVIRLMSSDAERAQSQVELWDAAARLAHPHLMRIFHSGRCTVDGGEVLYLVSEYAEESLAQVIPERALTPAESTEMLDPVRDALSYLHENGFVYGHLKPSNIMVVDNQVKLPLDHLYRPGVLPRASAHLKIYDAPEIAAGTIAPSADVWALGITIIEALTQLPPLCDRSTNRDPILPFTVPEPFAGIARGCLRVEPAKRSTLKEIKDSLRLASVLAEPANEIDQVAPSRIYEPVDEFREPGLSKRGIVALGAGALILLAIVLFLLLRSPKSQPAAPSMAQTPAPAKAAPPAPTPAPSAPAPASTPAPAPKAESEKSEVIDRVMPDVLASAVRTIHGKVEVRVRMTVDPTGTVSEAKLDSAGPSRYFAGKALEAARKWRFIPARVRGEAVASVWTLRFTFRRGGTQVDPAQVSP